MKKVLSMILALAMVLALGVCAFAEDLTTDEYSGDISKDITATYTGTAGAVSAGNIYSVVLTWTDVSVSYDGGSVGKYQWDPTSLTYKFVENSATAASWTDDGIIITVENRSNDSITATATYVESGDETLTFDNDGKVTLTSAAVKDGSVIECDDTTTVGTAQSGTITGTMGGSITAAGQLGKITITLSKTA